MSTYGAPVEEFDEQIHEGHIRVRRATCDLLSFEIKGIKINDSACAAHCITRGKRGGYCNDYKVCVCRK
ncbi:unnamed protein product [Ceutorhynchus assimilis]|uniref:Invertebrate defensins family profile domain-containing protein n=1 Tax=Ceutorhynchus assimilis TaxID=467358 RepID=A0A9N9QR08_9CUCU|nr:unnamed protein product [Ceutorhynchus assimilis]